MPSLVPRPFPPPVFDVLQVSNNWRREQLGTKLGYASRIAVESHAFFTHLASDLELPGIYDESILHLY